MPKLKLRATHVHAGEVYFAGAILDVDDQTADWIVRHQIGEVVNKEDSQSADAAKDKKAIGKKGRKE